MFKCINTFCSNNQLENLRTYYAQCESAIGNSRNIMCITKQYKCLQLILIKLISFSMLICIVVIISFLDKTKIKIANYVCKHVQQC